MLFCQEESLKVCSGDFLSWFQSATHTSTVNRVEIIGDRSSVLTYYGQKVLRKHIIIFISRCMLHWLFRWYSNDDVARHMSFVQLTCEKSVSGLRDEIVADIDNDTGYYLLESPIATHVSVL